MAMRKRMVKDLSNFGLGKGGKFSPRSSLTFMPGSAQPWLCPWMCWHPQAELGPTRTPCAAARWGELGAE